MPEADIELGFVELELAELSQGDLPPPDEVDLVEWRGRQPGFDRYLERQAEFYESRTEAWMWRFGCHRIQ